jgi:hypothetical protein
MYSNGFASPIDLFCGAFFEDGTPTKVLENLRFIPKINGWKNHNYPSYRDFKEVILLGFIFSVHSHFSSECQARSYKTVCIGTAGS